MRKHLVFFNIQWLGEDVWGQVQGFREFSQAVSDSVWFFHDRILRIRL
jgi:hypothetical protein